MGYGDYAPKNSAGQIWAIVYMLANIIMQAWIIGSISLLVVKADETVGAYRSTLTTLETYSKMHNFDDHFERRLRRQLKLDFNTRYVSDEEVLKSFTSTVRCRVLRKLYLPSLFQTNLMHGVPQEFVDAFLATCTVELFSPGEESLQRGDILSDLFLLVGGTVSVSSGDESIAHGILDFSSLSSKKEEGGQFLNEIGFFTESPQVEHVRSLGICKTLTMPRVAYKLIAEDHPNSAAKILQNLLSKLEATPIGSESTTFPALRNQKNYTGESTTDILKMRIQQKKDDHTTRFLHTASRGDVASVTLMCKEGLDPNSADSRTALIVAARKGNIDVVKHLLRCGADTNRSDVDGSTALFDAVKNGHEHTMQCLLEHNAVLGMSESVAASTLCQTVYEGDLSTLRLLLLARIQVNAANFDKRTAAHIAGAEGNLAALRLLREFHAEFSLHDCWGNTVEDEARQANATQILNFLMCEGI